MKETYKKIQKSAAAAAAVLCSFSLAACGSKPQTTKRTNSSASAAEGTKTEQTDKSSPSESKTEQSGSSAAAEADSGDKYTIYTSFYPMYDLTKKIVGNTAEVINIMPPGSSSHDFEPSAKQLADLSKADALVYEGAGMESWIEKAKEAMEKDNDKLVFVEASKGIDLLPSKGHEHHHDGEHEDADEHDEDEHDHDADKHDADAHDEDKHDADDHDADEHDHDADEHEHHHHGAYDPHLWLSPDKAVEMMYNIEKQLGEARPRYQDLYNGNYKLVKEQLDALDDEYTKRFKASGLKAFIVTHEAFGYVADHFGLEQKGLSGMGTEQEPNPDKMAEMVKYAKDNNIKVVYYDAEGSSKVADVLAGEIGAEVLPLYSMHSPSQDQLDQGLDYVKLMKMNLDNLLKGAPDAK